MILNVNKIGKKGIYVSDNVVLDDTILVEKDSFFMKNVDYKINLLRDGEKILIKGNIKTSVSLICSRCADDFEFKINSDFDLILFPINRYDLISRELNDEDLEYIFFEGQEIDVEKIIAEQVNFSIPLNPLCKTDCQGICPICGANLNREECKCSVNDRKLPSWIDIKE